jgi:hypothetical protein
MSYLWERYVIELPPIMPDPEFMEEICLWFPDPSNPLMFKCEAVQRPRRDALIYADRIVCHPSLVDKIEEGLKAMGAVIKETAHHEEDSKTN